MIIPELITLTLHNQSGMVLHMNVTLWNDTECRIDGWGAKVLPIRYPNQPLLSAAVPAWVCQTQFCRQRSTISSLITIVQSLRHSLWHSFPLFLSESRSPLALHSLSPFPTPSLWLFCHFYLIFARRTCIIFSLSVSLWVSEPSYCPSIYNSHIFSCFLFITDIITRMFCLIKSLVCLW